MNREDAHNLVDKIFTNLESTKNSFQEFLKSISPSEENLEKNTKDLRDIQPENPDKFLFTEKGMVRVESGIYAPLSRTYVPYEAYKELYELFKRTSIRLDGAEEEINMLNIRLKEEMNKPRIYPCKD